TMSHYVPVLDTPEMQRVRENQRNFSTIQYKESLGQGTAIPDLPEVKRVRETQKNISLRHYKEGVGQGTSVSETPEMERVKRNQQNISMVLHGFTFYMLSVYCKLMFQFSLKKF
uniref:Nebulin n=1 Tax=Oryzias latipes TaxID=8090 RepID=A0A3B3I791_ORYLA